MTPIGYNHWSVNDGNENIRHGYLFSEKRSEYSWRYDLWGTWAVSKPVAIRLPFILCERDPDPTDFGHITPKPREVELFRNAVRNCPMPERYASIVRLWEATWLAGEQGVNLGNNPYPDAQELSDALFQSLELIMDGLPPGVRIDLDCETVFDEAFRLYYPRAAELCRNKGIEFSASVIVDIGGQTDRHLQAIGAISELARMDFTELHWNGESPDVIKSEANRIVGEAQQRFGLPVVIGECDCELTPGALAALLNSGAQRVILWQ